MSIQQIIRSLLLNLLYYTQEVKSIQILSRISENGKMK